MYSIFPTSIPRMGSYRFLLSALYWSFLICLTMTVNRSTTEQSMPELKQDGLLLGLIASTSLPEREKPSPLRCYSLYIWPILGLHLSKQFRQQNLQRWKAFFLQCQHTMWKNGWISTLGVHSQSSMQTIGMNYMALVMGLLLMHPLK